MVVITLEKCPLSLRGDLTKWLQEISPGVYVGQVSARVRDKLWDRVCMESKQGRATMVFSARNEQHLNFRVHNSLWEPIDFDGIKLMLRPSAARLRNKKNEGPGFSTASKARAHAKRNKTHKAGEPSVYVVVDVETTGLDIYNDSIVELGALRVCEGHVDGTFHTLVACDRTVPDSITELTGLTSADVERGVPIKRAMDEFLRFIGSYPLVTHNMVFDMGFIDAALEDLDYDSLENDCFDTLELAKKKLPGLTSYKLSDLCGFYEIPVGDMHRAIPDCHLAHELFVHLMDDGG